MGQEVIDVYIYGCTTCGTNALLLNRIRSLHEVTVYNSAQVDNRTKHSAYLNEAGIDVKTYTPIIVVNNGERIMRLSEWKSL